MSERCCVLEDDEDVLHSLFGRAVASRIREKNSMSKI